MLQNLPHATAGKVTRMALVLLGRPCVDVIGRCWRASMLLDPCTIMLVSLVWVNRAISRGGHKSFSFSLPYSFSASIASFLRSFAASKAVSAAGDWKKVLGRSQ